MNEISTLPEPRKHEYIVPEHARETKCRCGKAIAFGVTPKKAQVPLSLATAEVRDGKTYALSHFLDCANVASFSRKKKQP